MEPGKLANLIVLDRNLFDVPLDQIGDTQVHATLFEGRCVYQVGDREESPASAAGQ